MHRMRVFVFTLLFAVSALAQDARVQAFEKFAEEAMRGQQMPGLSVAVVHGDFRWARGFGFADVENEVPARADSSYRMASVTKPMTAAGVLKLVDEGKIDLDAEVQTYVPWFPKKAQKITVRQLLAHQGGISHYRDYMKEGRIREPKTTREAIAIFQDWDLIAEPGTKYSYSSYGYNLLGAVIEGASGKPYGEFMTENVWKPLGMTSTRMDDPRAVIPHRVTGYVLEGGKLQRSEYVDISSRFGGGGTRSTVEDMVRFVEGLAAGKVLKPETRELAWTAMPTKDKRLTDYGLGFGIVQVGGRWGVEHTGAQQETRTLLLYLPREKFAVALASNFEDASLSVFENELVRTFLQQPRDVNMVTHDEADTPALRAIDGAYSYGLAYYDRYGKAMTTDAGELAKAFKYFQDATKDAKLAGEGRNPAAGEPLTKVGSYIASVLAANGDLGVYHREGALRFFADYARVAKANRLDKAFADRVTQWSADWAKVWTPELQSMDLSTNSGVDTFMRNRDPLSEASIRPDFSGGLLRIAENALERDDLARALVITSAGYQTYPRSSGLNGLLGVIALLNQDGERSRALLSASLQLDPNGYASAGNLLDIADFLARKPERRPVAVALMQIASEMHPNDAKVKAKLEELQKP